MAERIDHGGLMRCCILSWHERRSRGDLPTDPGATIDCHYEVPGNGKMRLNADGVWEWEGVDRIRREKSDGVAALDERDAEIQRLREDVRVLREAMASIVDASPCGKTIPPLDDHTPLIILGSRCMALNGPEYERNGGTWPHPLYGRRDFTAKDLYAARAALARTDPKGGTR